MGWNAFSNVPCFSKTAKAVSCLERTIRMTFFSPLAVGLLASVVFASGDFDAVLESQLPTVCGSDLRIAKHGDDRIVPPRILGHEISARVIDAGTLVGIEKGDFVAIGADIPCGKCNYCKIGRPNLCLIHTAIGYQLDGGFAEHLIIPNQFLEYSPIVKVE